MATDSNGLYYMRARYYNPDIKRFINQDIKVGDIGSSQSLNRYAYCEGNPVSMVDPFGLCGEDANDQGEKSKYEKWHNFLGTAGIFWDGFDLINGALYAAEGDYVNAAISFACGVPAVGNIVAGVAKMSKAVKAMKTASKIADMCKAVGKAGNTAAGMKAVYDTYQTAQRECNTTSEKVAYMAGTLITGYAAGKAASWGANKLKNLANKAMPKLKTAVQEGAGKLANQISKGLSFSGSGHMNRNRGYVVNPFYKGGSKTGTYYHSCADEVADIIADTGFRTDLPNEVAAFQNNRYGRGVYLADSPATALAERPGGTILKVSGNKGKNLDITSRGVIGGDDYTMTHAIARGARKHGYDSITFMSAKNPGGVNTVIFNSANVKVEGILRQ